MNTTRAIMPGLLGSLLAVGFLLVGCTGEPPDYPAPTPAGPSGAPIPPPAGVIVLPDNDRMIQVRTVCDNGNRLYIIYGRYSNEHIDVKVIPQDPSCKETPQ